MASSSLSPERGGAAIVLHMNGHVLLQKRTADAPRWPSMWGVFGGNFDAGEDPVHAAAREVAEELSISIDPASSLSIPAMILESVDFPAPFPPTRA